MNDGCAIWRISVHGQRFVGVVVELANPADAARFVAVGDFAAEFARDTHQLLDLLDRTRFALAVLHPEIVRSEERRVGKECVSTCRSRWSPYNYKTKHTKNQINYTLK